MTENIYPSLSPGVEISGYRIESLLGRGRMAVVFQARDLRLNRLVRLKVLAPELSESPQSRERFLHESRLAASLDHPNIIPVYDAGEEHGLLFIAMRLVGGVDLAALLQEKGRLSPTNTVGILAQVAAALDAAHAVGLVHGDVRPDDIRVVPTVVGQQQDHVYLSDFGLARRATSLSEVTAQGQSIATTDYAAPEQIGSRQVDARTDVYGLGCVAYQCLTGTVPFVRDNEAALLWAHLVERPPPLSAHCSELAPFDAALAQALEKTPEDRFASCGQFIDALAAVLPAPVGAEDQLGCPVTRRSAAAPGQLSPHARSAQGRGVSRGQVLHPSPVFRMSVRFPRRLSMGYSATFLVQIYPPAQEASAVIEQERVFDGVAIGGAEDDVQLPYIDVEIELSCPAIRFSSPVRRRILPDGIRVHFWGQPSESARPGRHSGRMFVRKPDDGLELHSVAFVVDVADYAFDHMSRPVTGRIVSVLLLVLAVIAFVFGLVTQGHQVIGLAAGAVTAALSAFLTTQVTVMYRRPSITMGDTNES